MKKRYTYLTMLFMMISSLMNAQWTNPNLGSLKDVSFVKGSMTTAFAIGEKGKLLKTLDGGLSWTEMNVPLQNLKNICFASSSVGFITEYGNSKLLKTLDGGTTWNLINSDIQAPIEKIYFISPDTGFVSVPWMGMLRTIDGGQKWMKWNESNTINDFFFVNSMKGFAVGNNKSLYKTLNAGQTWYKVDSFMMGGDFKSIYFTDALTGYITNNMGYLLKTVDGGDIWTYQWLDNGLGKIDFFGPANGCILGENGKYFIGAGNTWTLDTLEGNLNISSIALAKGGTRGIMVGDNGTLVNSSNAGATWVVQNTGMVDIASIGFKDVTTGFIVGANNPQILKTIDGGNTFTPNYQFGNYGFTKIQFLNSNDGYAACSNGWVFKTIDGGATWINYVVAGSEIRSMSFASVANGVVSSYDNMTYKTSNGGTFWTPVFGMKMDDLKLLPNSGIGFGVSSNDQKIYKTTDTGSSWSPILFASNQYLRGLAVIDANIAVACGESMGKALIRKTIDGGINWDTKFFDSTAGLNAIHFSDPNNGIAVGYNGTILRTSDGGTTWIKKLVDPGVNLKDITFNGSDWYAVGSNGILKLFNASVSTDTLQMNYLANSTRTFTLNISGNWKAFSNQPYISVTPPTGENTATITVKTTENLLQKTDTLFAYIAISQTGIINRDVIVAKVKILHETFSFTPDTIFASADSSINVGSKYFYITSSKPINLIGSAPWIKNAFLNTNGFNGTNYTYSINEFNVENNPLSVKRLGYIILSMPGLGNQNLPVVQFPAPPKMMINKSSLNFGYNAALMDSIKITSNSNWTIACAYPWLTFSQTTGSGNATVFITATQNSAPSQRMATFSISLPNEMTPLSIIVLQDANPSASSASLILDKVSVNLPYTAAATDSFKITTTAAWTISSSFPWIALDKTSGTGNATIIITSSLNTGPGQRVSIVSVAVSGQTPQSLQVVQDGNPTPPSPTLTLDKASITLPYTVGAIDSFHIVSSAAWNITTSHAWINLNKTSGTGNATIVVASTLNTNASQRIAIVSVTISGQTPQSLQVAQDGNPTPPSSLLVIDKTSFSLPYSAGKIDSFHIVSPAAWTITSSQPWVTISKMSGTGNATVIITSTLNPSTSQRIATLSVVVSGVTPQTIQIVQDGSPANVIPALTIDKTAINLPYTANAKDSIKITSNVAWTVTSPYPWVSLDKASGTGNGVVTLTSSLNNNSAQRLATLTVTVSGISPQSVLIVQDGNPTPVTCTHQANILNTTIPALCMGDSIILTANSGTGYLYQWFIDGMMAQAGGKNTFVCKKAGNYHVSINNNNCTVLSTPVKVNFYPEVVKPIITKKAGEIKPCTGGTVTLKTTAAYTSYQWSTGGTADSISVSKSDKYSVKVKDANGCSAVSDPFEINASEASTPEMCVVTVDRLDNKNVIVWKRNAGQKIARYRIYKETTQANVYEILDSSDYTGYNFVIDNNSNPAIRSNRYAVSAVDSCGVESPRSIIHKTLHLNINQRYGGGVNLIWENYEGLDFSSYVIYHGDSKMDMKQLIDVPSNITSYTILDDLKKYYLIAVKLPGSCDLASMLKAESGPYSQSLSNIAEFKTSSLSSTNFSNLAVFPNPFAEQLTVKYNLTVSADVKIEILNAIGQKIAEKVLPNQQPGESNQIFAAKELNMEPGLCIIKVSIGQETMILKAIYNK